MIRLADASVDAEGRAAVAGVLASGQLVQAGKVGEFERLLASRVTARGAVVVNSGTSALHLALLSLGIGAGDRVAVAAYSYPASANAIELCGATPVFVDVDPGTFNIDLDRLAATLAADDQGIRAILPVHTFGQPCDMAGVERLAREYEVPVVEDAACALGASWAGRAAGSWGAAGCFSFHPRKAITTGEGGAICSDLPEVLDRVARLRNHGQSPGDELPEFVEPGYNFRLTEIQAALGVYQLGRLDEIVARRRAIAALYDAAFSDTPVRPPVVAREAASVYQSYVLTLPESIAAERRAIIRGLAARGVEATIGTYAMPLIRYYRDRYGHAEEHFPVASRLFRSSLAIPLHERLSDHDCATVIEATLRSTEAVAIGDGR